MQRLLVTGGCGYLGRELVRIALGAGMDVRATWWHRPPLDLGAEWVQADVRDREAMARATEGMDAVVHTAYVQGEGEWDVNVEGTASVAEAARDMRFVHLSTDLVFDGTRGRYREEDLPAPVNSYGRSTAAAEKCAMDIHGAPTIVRTSLIYGGAEAGPQERLALQGRRFFVDELRSPVQVTDLAMAIHGCLDMVIHGALHLAGADDVSRYELALLLGADPDRIERAHTTPDRAPNVTLDSSRAAKLLGTRLRGVYEVLGQTFSNVPNRSSCT